MQCESLDQVREGIDQIDAKIVGLIAERGGYVLQAARFKKDRAEVAAPQRVEQVIAKTMALATKLNADPVVVEKVYRAMISGFIEMELSAHEQRKL
ncbi:MAG: chorismate mutase [Stenotrophomonas geniculata]